MKVGVDAFPIAGRLAGIGRYVLEILRALDGIMPNSQFYLYSPKPFTVDLPLCRYHLRIGGSLVARIGSSYAWLTGPARAMAVHDGVEVFWATRTILPGRSRAFRTVSTVHDLNFLMFPNAMPYATFLAHRIWFARDVRRADAVVTNSQGTADRLRNMLGVDADAVARPGVAEIFGPQTVEWVAARLSALDVRTPYFLAVGTVEPRKNLSALVEAFISLKRSGELRGYELLIAGGPGWRTRRSRTLFDQAQFWGVRWLGFVTDEDLVALYAGSQAFVFPSLYEGFGIPAAEARACGALVVATDIPELREASGIHAIYIEPTVEGIRRGLLKAAEGRPQVASYERRFTWSDAAQVMAAQFRSLR